MLNTFFSHKLLLTPSLGAIYLKFLNDLKWNMKDLYIMSQLKCKQALRKKNNLKIKKLKIK